MNKNGMEAKIQTPPAMEAFEQRLLLAGDVLAEVTGAGDLVITGDAEANQISVTVVDGTVTIRSGVDVTTVNGADAGAGVDLDGIFSRHIKIKMGDGDDLVIIGGDDGGDGPGGGNDTLFDIDGNVQIDLGPGVAAGVNQEAMLDLVDVAGSIKITTKDNEAYTLISNSTVGKNVQIALGGGDNYAGIEDTTVGGNVKIQNKDGAAEVYVDGSDVGGSVSIANGKGLYVVQIDSSLIGKNLSVKNKELVSGNPADVQVIKVWDTNIDGSVNISSGKGDAYLEIDDANAGDTNGDGVVIGKKLSISSKDGDDTVYVHKTTAASIKVSTGKGGDATTRLDVEDITTAGSLALTNKSGITIIDVARALVVKKTTLTGGKAATTVGVWDTVATGGLQIKGGGKVTGGLLVDIENLTGGEKTKVSIAGGGDADVLNIDDIDVASLQIKTGAGADVINIERTATGGAVSTLDTLKISTGDGNDIVTIGSAAGADRGLTLAGKGKLDGGKGTDTLDASAARGNTFDEDLLTLKNFELGDSVD